ncbi:MAG: metallophosphoesterase [Deltaproteobacteria bacterium]|nr:metallophosphoesterase [Deltaproteobacteria bacterium]
MPKRVIFSDLHFGDPQCSLRWEVVTKGLRNFLRGLGPVDELILAGDILDANISSLTTAIEGVKGSGTWPKQMGFRQWLAFLFAAPEFNVNRIVYLPGNHDYIIWNILSTDQAFVQPISQGKVPTGLPLMNGVFPAPFIRGVAPKEWRDRFVVVYPNYEFTLSGQQILVTHGHYLDDKQTLFKDLDKLIRKAGGDEAKAVRNFFIGTAQYQAVANAISYLKGSRTLVEKVYKALDGFWSMFGKLRNQPIDADMLTAIDFYLRYVAKKQPDVFIFGHTHEAGHTFTKAAVKGSRKVEVWNDGSFLEVADQNLAGTFLLVEDGGSKAKITLYEVNLEGQVGEKRI